jgi:rare lipoprotein A
VGSLGRTDSAVAAVLRIACITFVLTCASYPGYCVAAQREAKETKQGLASFVAKAFHGDKTASGEIFDKDDFVAAHPSYPFGTRLRVTNLENDKSVEVRIVDRGPSPQNRKEGVIIDLSRAAAEKLGFIKDGRVKVRTEVLKWGEPPN